MPDPTAIRTQDKAITARGLNVASLGCVDFLICYSCAIGFGWARVVLTPAGGSDCYHNWTGPGDGGDPCDDFDETTPPDWYIQEVYDRFFIQCGRKGTIDECGLYSSAGIVSLCCLLPCWKAILDGGDPPDISGPGPAPGSPGWACWWAWKIIVSWWGSVGESLANEYCVHGTVIGPLVPGQGLLILFKSRVLVRRPTVVQNGCITKPVGEECDECT